MGPRKVSDIYETIKQCQFLFVQDLVLPHTNNISKIHHSFYMSGSSSHVFFFCTLHHSSEMLRDAAVHLMTPVQRKGGKFLVESRPLLWQKCYHVGRVVEVTPESGKQNSTHRQFLKLSPNFFLPCICTGQQFSNFYKC